MSEKPAKECAITVTLRTISHILQSMKSIESVLSTVFLVPWSRLLQLLFPASDLYLIDSYKSNLLK